VDAVVDIYRDPMFWLFPIGASAVSMLTFALFAAPLTWIAWRAPAALERYRIQKRRGKPHRIIGPSIRWWLLNNAVLTALVIAAWPVLRHTGVHAGPLPPWWEVIGSIVLFIYLDDALFYFMHRALHTPWLYKRVHAIHHRLTTPWAVGAHYMHPLEFVAIGGLMLVGPLLLGSHLLTVYLWIAFRQFEAAEGHSGYSFPWNPAHLFPGYGGTEFHDFHHAKFFGNYSGFLGWVDHALGTRSEGFAEHMAQKREAAR
jgi:4-alpha-methyl-delta7-sterol-4alpha-methyl oxidase